MRSHARGQVTSPQSRRIPARSLVRSAGWIVAGLLACNGLVLIASPVIAAPGDADPSFGTNGVVVTDTEQLFGYPASTVSTAGLARQSDGSS